MKIELTKVDGKVVGYKIVAESVKDSYTLGSVRNLHFFGFDDTAIEYDGRKSTKDEEGREYVQELLWIQRQHQKH